MPARSASYFSFAVSALAILLQADVALAATDIWSNEGPQGAAVLSVAVDPSNASTVYVGTDGGGIFKSTDGGVTWAAAREGVGGGAVRQIEIDPHAPQTLYARTLASPAGGRPAGLFKSSNGGSSWERVDTGLPAASASDIAFDGQTAGVVYAAVRDSSDGGVFKSTDGGQVWIRILDPETFAERNVSSVAVDPTDSRIIYAVTSVRILKTANGGATWDPASSGLPFFSGGDRIEDLAFDSGDSNILYAAGLGGFHPSYIYKTVDGGATWDPTTEEPAGVRRIVADPSRPGTLYALSSDGISKTTNAGGRWDLMITGLPPRRFSYNAFDLAPSDSQRLYFGMGASAPFPVYRSVDAAANWEPAGITGLTNAFALSLAVDPDDPTIRYTAVERSSTDGNRPLLKGGVDPESWNEVQGVTDVLRVVIDPVDNNIIYAGTASDGTFKSTDSGAMWRRSNIGISGSFVLCLTLNPLNRTVLYACANATLARSVNSGANWTPIDDDLRDESAAQPARPRVVAVDPTTATTLYVTTIDQGIFKSLDGGDTWDPADVGLASPAMHAIAIDPTNPQVVYAGAFVPGGTANPGGVFKSIDGGASWAPANGGDAQPIGAADIRALSVDGACPQIVYAATNAGVFRSVDGASSWSALNEGLFTLDVRALVIDPLDRSTVHVATYGGGIFSIEQTDVASCPATPTPGGPTLTPTNTVMATATPTATATATLVSSPCAGDCDGSGSVRVDELIRGVRIALDLAPVSTCTAVDGDGDSIVRVDELVRAVQRSLRGC